MPCHPLLVRLDVLGAPLGEEGVVLGAHRAQRRPDGDVLLLHALRRRVAVGLLERHAGRVEAGGGDGVAVAHVEQVVDVAVEVRDGEALERGLDRRADLVIDPLERGLADVVVDRVGVGREEVRRPAHLVGVDEDLRRQLPEHLELAVGLRLGAGEPVAVHVEAVGVAPGVRLPSVRVLRRQDDDDRIVEDLLGGAVGAGGELVEHPQGGVGAALLTPVHVPRDPQDRRHRADDLAGLRLGGAVVAQPRDVTPDLAQPGLGHPLLLPHDRVAQWAALDGGREHPVDDVRARRGDGGEVAVGLLRRDVAIPEVDADHVPRRGDARIQGWRGERIALSWRLGADRIGHRRGGRGRPRRRGGREQGRCERYRSPPTGQSCQGSGAAATHGDPQRSSGRKRLGASLNHRALTAVNGQGLERMCPITAPRRRTPQVARQAGQRVWRRRRPGSCSGSRGVRAR